MSLGLISVAYLSNISVLQLESHIMLFPGATPPENDGRHLFLKAKL